LSFHFLRRETSNGKLVKETAIINSNALKKTRSQLIVDQWKKQASHFKELWNVPILKALIGNTQESGSQ
jgi:hypothetical protein